MTKQFEDDEVLAQLQKSAIKKTEPLLTEELLHSAASPKQVRASRNTRRPRLLFGVSAGVAVMSIALFLGNSHTASSDLTELNFKSDIEFLSISEGKASSMPTGDNTMDIFIPTMKASQSGLSEKEGTGLVYRARNIQDRDLLLNKLANYFGVQGSPVERDGYKAYLGDELGTSGSVYVSSEGSLSFTYLNASDESKTPVLDITRENALKIFTDFGLKVALDDIHLKFNRAVAYVKVGDQDSPLSWTLLWGSDKRIYSFTGSAVEFLPVVEVKTISPSDAFERLNILSWSEGQVVVLHEDRVDPVSPRNLIETCRPFGSKPCEVMVTSSVPSLGYLRDAGGVIWLVPSHSFYVGGILAGGASALPSGGIKHANVISTFPTNKE